MNFFRSIYKKYKVKRATSKIWREHGGHTEFHLTGPQFNIARGGVRMVCLRYISTTTRRG